MGNSESVSVHFAVFAEKTMNELLDQYYIHFGIKNQKQDRVSLRLTRYFNFRLKYIVVRRRQGSLDSSRLFRCIQQYKTQTSIVRFEKFGCVVFDTRSAETNGINFEGL